MHTTKALLPNVLILVVNALRVLLACCKHFSLISIHTNYVKTKPGYKTDLKDLDLDEAKKPISKYMCMLTCSSFHTRTLLCNGLLRRRLRVA